VGLGEGGETEGVSLKVVVEEADEI